MALVFFDYDGVMVDSLESEARYFAEACQEVGVDAVKNADDMARLSEGNFYEGLAALGVTAEQSDAIMSFYAKIKTDGRFPIAAFPEVLELLKKVAERYPVYIVTSNVSATVESRLKEYDVKGVKDVLGADKEPSKVKKLRSVMERYPGERTVFLGDTKGDMVEADEVGIDIRLGVTWGWQKPEVVLEGDPDYCFTEKADLVAWWNGFMDGDK
ncbi:MAG: HAD family hydrolase [Bacillota bacterium]|jgi:phosphoglycolate phosphatase